MPVTLAQAKLLTTDDIDLNVINEFQKNNFILDRLPFHDVVNAGGAGATLTYGYTRQLTQRTAAFRALNTEYTPTEVTVGRFSTDLKPLGGSFQIDRVLARVAAGGEVTLQMQNLIASTSAKFNDAVINGDVSVDANGFDGLSKALVGSVTETGATAVTDLRAATIGGGVNSSAANDALDRIDTWLRTLNGRPDAILCNVDGMSRLQSLARRAGYLDSTMNGFGQQIDSYRGIPFIDLGAKDGTNNPVIPTTAKTVATIAGNYTDIYAVRFGLDAFHGVSMAGAPLLQTWLPPFDTPGAVKTGEVELGPVSVVLKATKGAAVLRNVLVS
jgi:hypothetical protein